MQLEIWLTAFDLLLQPYQVAECKILVVLLIAGCLSKNNLESGTDLIMIACAAEHLVDGI